MLDLVIDDVVAAPLDDEPGIERLKKVLA